MPPDQIEATGQWAAPPQQQGPFGAPPPPQQHIPETTGAFALPPQDDPPAPGDVKVYGEPTVVEGRMPAWADAETSFLASGWSGQEDLGGDGGEPPSRRRRGRKRPPRDEWNDRPTSGGRTRLALLGVAAVAVVLGGTVAGVKIMSSSSETPAPSVANPSISLSVTPETEETEPAEDPTEDASPEADAAAPTPTATATAPAPRRSATPTPTPTKTKKKAQPTSDPDPTPTQSDTPTTEETQPQTLTDDDVSVPPTGSATDPVPSPTTESQSGGGSAGPSVSVTLDVTKQLVAGYTAELVVVNDSAKTLRSLTLSVPVGGEVYDVKGADWTQDGDLLILDLSGAVRSGEAVTLDISAKGAPQQPENCGLVGGHCLIQ
ncbi:hypothetical protein ACIBG8_40560 [Nonomuraea sp. NPDC050556]|uniref:hypothetical protein n=1 Tax=Nonomuraea sp. NPDC050556 TaxID=3364369 RepID=UPI003795263A